MMFVRVTRCAAITATVLLVLFAQVGMAANKAGPRFARFITDGTTSYGLVEGNRVRRIAGSPFGRWQRTAITFALADVELLTPTTPSKVLALAGNYKSHLQDKPVPAHPELFLKPPSCLIANGQTIVLPRDSRRVDAEGELVIVIGKRARNVPVAKAHDYVLGITCGCDVSARDWQKNDVQWVRAKGTDTFGPCGPFIATGIPYDDLRIRLRVNGQVRQDARTRDMIHGVDATVSWASRYITLEPGDLIFTGTPGTTPTLKPGDQVEVELEGVGVLRNPVAAQQAE